MRPRRLVSLLVAGCMVVSMVPASAVTAFADAGAGTSQTAEATTTAVAQIRDTTYSTLQAAVNAAGQTATTIVLQNSTTESVKIPAGANITLDLNGHTIQTADNSGHDAIVNLGVLTVKDSKTGGKIISKHNSGIGIGPNSTTTVEYAEITGREGAIGGWDETVGATVTINDGVFTGEDNAVVIFNGSRREGAANEITINGGTFKGTIKTGGYVACGIYAPWKDIITVNNGTFNITNGAGIVARAGNVTVNGGTFNTSGNVTGKVGDSRVVVPCAALVFDSEANYPGLSLDSKIEVKDGKFSSEVDAIAVVGGDNERVAVSGGEFSSDPSAYCVTGKIGKKSSNGYTVENRTYDDVKTDVKPEGKPDTTVNGEKDEPVDIDVTISGDQDQMECIDTVSLNFSDVSAVKTVELSAYGRTISLDKYAATEYQNMPLAELEEAFRNAEDGTSAAQIALCDVESAENGPEEEEMDALTLTLHVTYKTEGKYKVGVVFKDPNSTVVSEQTANVQIGEMKSKLTFTDCTATVDGKEIASGDEVAEGKTVTLKLAANVDQMKFGGFVLDPQQDSLKKVDDTTATFTMPDVPVTVTVQLNAEDSDGGVDALTVVAGVAVGAGTAVLAYHIGTEVYAEQVLGKGVAVPKTRTDVALKAWELAGKPAVAVGEPLSEAAQAEKWAVESGLMQNDAQGSFNGQKKMNKLAALRTLDAAKKLG